MVFLKGMVYLCPFYPEGGLGQKGDPAQLDPLTFLLHVLHVVPKLPINFVDTLGYLLTGFAGFVRLAHPLDHSMFNHLPF
jgi:hypothetical protein